MSGTILLVEDNFINQKVAYTLLIKAGHNVALAKDGAEALSLAKEKDFALILMDVQMPIMGGIECTKKIREFERQTLDRKNTPIIALTAHAMKGDLEKCLQAGMNGYLSKPIKKDELLEVIKKNMLY